MLKMNQPAIAVLISGLLPIVCAGIAKWGARDYDNHDPRAWLASQSGRRARANAAQANSFEAFPFFAAAVALALYSGASVEAVAPWAWGFVAMRVAYIYAYVADRSTLRSIVWWLGVLATIRLYLLAI